MLDKHGKIHECRARGRFRKDGITPLPGDRVVFALETEQTIGYIEEILARKTLLVRPAVANVSVCCIVISPKKPAPDLLLLDKLLIQCRVHDIKTAIIINKIDLADEQEIAQIREQYEKGFRMIEVSAKRNEKIDEIKALLKGECTCFAGQSAVGKSSIINALFPAFELKTGAVSEKSQRGRHTTRHAQLLRVDGTADTVVDTPGFSMFEALDIKPGELMYDYPEMQPHIGRCKYASCLHDAEPECSVKQAVEDGQIPKERYRRYLIILQELKEKRANQYG